MIAVSIRSVARIAGSVCVVQVWQLANSELISVLLMNPNPYLPFPPAMLGDPDFQQQSIRVWLVHKRLIF